MKMRDIFTLIWYNIKSKKRSAFYLLLGFFFIVLIIQSFLVYTSVLDRKYEDIVKNDENNFLVLNRVIDQMDFDYIRSFNKTEFIISTQSAQINDFDFSQSILKVDNNEYIYSEPFVIPKQSKINVEFKNYHQFLIPFFIRNYHQNDLVGGRYLKETNEVLISSNFLTYYNILLEDILYKNIVLSDSHSTLVDDMFVAGVVKDEISIRKDIIPVNQFRVVTLNNPTAIQQLTNQFDVTIIHFNHVYFSTYETIMVTINALNNHFGSNIIEYSGEDSADMVVLIVRQSVFAKEMFQLIGSILIVAMLISLIVSIIFRIKNQAVYISISHVYGMKKRYLLLSIYIEFLSIYMAATIFSTFTSYGLFRFVNRIFEPTFMINLVPSAMDLVSSFIFLIFLGILIVSFYSTIVIIVIKQYKPISILRMSNRV
jgi:hypothetical protein